MPKRKKINPRKIPASQADIKRAKKHIADDVFDASVAMILSALLDKGFLDAEQIHDAWEAINDKSKSVNKGYCSIVDLINVLDEEYDIKLKGR